MSPLIEVTDPAFSGPDTILIDARGGKDSYDRYLTGHLKNAAYVDLDQDLAAKTTDPSIGGRHPLPAIGVFAEFLGSLGITPDSHVVIYDDKSGAFSAARLWWMMSAVGHKKVQVLNGGLKVAFEAGVVLSTEAYRPTAKAPYPVTPQYNGTITIEETGDAAHDAERLVIDVREAPRYLGQTEPLDLIAGHIPGALNLPYIDNLGTDGRYLPADELYRAYSDAFGQLQGDKIIVHCGSGVTACHTLLGMAYAGITGPKLYVGSWSEWSRRDLPIAKGER